MSAFLPDGGAIFCNDHEHNYHNFDVHPTKKKARTAGCEINV